VLKAVTVSDADLKNYASQMRARDDKRNASPAGDAAAKRLARLTAKHVNEDGLNLNFKVYRSSEINANATADGSIRFYTGLMAMLTDQELLGIIGHEIGHVKNGSTLAKMRIAYLASAGRKAAAASSGVAGALADSDLGAIGEQLVKSQYSQSEETGADDYGLAFMKRNGYDAKAMESAFRKMAALDGKSAGGLNQMLSTHPDSAKRADRMRDKLAQR
jgi:putative metalloprotease